MFTPTNKPIEEATDNELRDFLVNVLMIEAVDKLKTREKLLAAIDAAGWKQPHVMVLIAAETEVERGEEIAPKRVAETVTNNAHYKDDPLITLQIGETPLPGGNEPAYVSVNGRSVVIKRNTLVKLPYRFYLALKDAHEVQVRQDPHTLQMIHTKVTNYPIEVEERPSKAEIAAWEEKVNGLALGA